MIGTAGLLLALVWLFWGAGSGADAGALPAPGASDPAPTADAAAGELSQAQRAAPRTPADGADGAPRPMGEWPAVFQGSAVIRGQVVVPAGVALPEHGVVRIGPAQYKEGRDRAVRRELPFTREDPTFEFAGVPQAAYRIEAAAAGMNSRFKDVLLVKGSSEIFTTIELRPAGFLEGRVVDEEGRPVEGLAVVLVDQRSGTELEATSDAAGGYHFPRVLDGPYEIYFGPRTAPLRGPELLDFQGRSLTYPQRELPVTGSIRFVVLDEHGGRLEGVSLRGFGDGGGPIDLLSDDRGEAIARHLPPGSYRVRASHPSGRHAKASFKVRGGEELELIQVMCVP